MVIIAKIKERSRSDGGIRTDTRRPAVQHGPVGQKYQVCQLDIGNKVLYELKQRHKSRYSGEIQQNF